MIQLRKSGTFFSGSSEELEQLRADFDRQHWIRLPQLLELALLRLIQQRLAPSLFYERVHEGVGLEVCMTHDNTVGFLHFLANSPRLFDLIERITGCGRIGCFAGRVYRMLPGSGHYDSWHSDRIEHRMIAMSLNLSTGLYSGGTLQLRDRESRRILCQVPNTGFGDAILFRIDDRLQHRITRMEGVVPKTAFAGWFKSQPDYPFLPRDASVCASGLWESAC